MLRSNVASRKTIEMNRIRFIILIDVAWPLSKIGLTVIFYYIICKFATVQKTYFSCENASRIEITIIQYFLKGLCIGSFLKVVKFGEFCFIFKMPIFNGIFLAILILTMIFKENKF